MPIVFIPSSVPLGRSIGSSPCHRRASCFLRWKGPPIVVSTRENRLPRTILDCSLQSWLAGPIASERERVDGLAAGNSARPQRRYPINATRHLHHVLAATAFNQESDRVAPGIYIQTDRRVVVSRALRGFADSLPNLETGNLGFRQLTGNKSLPVS